MREIYTQNARAGHADIGSSIEVNKVLRNTYMLLALTLAFSAVTAGIAMAVNMSHGMGLIMSIVAIVLVWFVLPKTANSPAGLGVVFAFTGLIGARSDRQPLPRHVQWWLHCASSTGRYCGDLLWSVRLCPDYP